MMVGIGRANNVIIENCVLENFRGETIYGGWYIGGGCQIINTKIRNSVTGISLEGIKLIKGCEFRNITFNSFEAYITEDMVFEDCIFEDCNRGIQALNMDRWALGTICEIKNCTFKNLNSGIAMYTGGVRKIYDNLFQDCAIYFEDSDGQDNAEIIYENNIHIENTKRVDFGSIFYPRIAKLSVINNKYIRTDEAKNNNIKGSMAIYLRYGEEGELYEIGNSYFRDNYVEEGFCTYGSSNIDTEILWDSNKNANYSRSFGGTMICAGGNKTFLDYPDTYNRTVYRPTRIEISGMATEKCFITIKIEYYNQDASITEETILEKEVNENENFNIHFEKAMLMVPINNGETYPTITIYNDKNSSSAIVNAKYTIEQN